MHPVLPSLLLLVPALPTRAADVEILEHLTTEDGLPQNWISQLAQAPDGHLWIATAEAFARYDGVEIDRFSRSTGSQRRDVRDMVPAGNHIWVASREGLARIDAGGRVSSEVSGRVPHDASATLDRDRDGRIWVLTPGRVATLEEGAWTVHPSTGCAPDDNIGTLIDRYLWCRDRPLVRLTETGVEPVLTRDGALVLPTRLHLIDSAGQLWMEQADGLQRHAPGSDGRLTAIGTPQPLVRLRLLIEDISGTIWAAADDTLYRWDGRRLARSLELDVKITSLLADRGGDLWLGTAGRGLFRVGTREGIRWLDVRNGLPDDLIWSVLPDADGTLWLGANAGVVQVDRGKMVAFHPSPFQGVQNRVFSLLDDPRGGLLAGASGGILSLDGGRVSILHPTATAIRGGLARDRDGTVWAGGENFLYSLREGELTQAELPIPLAGRYPAIGAVLMDRSGRLWVGTDSGLLVREGGAFRAIDESDGLPGPHVRGLWEAGDGSLWVTIVGGGLARVRDGAVHGLKAQEGLPAGTLHVAIADDHDALWLSSNRGIHRVPIATLEQAFAGVIPSVENAMQEVVPGVECNSGYPSAAKLPDGRLAFPTMKGLVLVDPASLAEEAVPLFPSIRQVIADHAPVPLMPSLALPAGTRSFAVSYTAPAFRASERVRYRIRLDGFDADWVQAGGRRSAVFTNLAPGPYTFRVQAANADGVWSDDEATQHLILLPFFYETTWFRAMVLLILSVVLFALVRYRVRVLRERELLLLVEHRTAALLSEKERTEHQAALLADQTEQLLALDAAKARFFANISHELRTPLAMILGPTDALLDDPRQPQRPALERVRRNAVRLQTLIDELLDLARLEEGRMPLHATEADLVAFARGRLDAFADLARTRNVC